MKGFASDNYAGVLPEVMQALRETNEAHAVSYGSDPVTEKAVQQFREVFQADADVFFVFNGTGANVLSLAAATGTHQAVLCADTSHIYNDESSAPETFTGCRIFPLPANEQGKLTPERVLPRLIRKGDIHYAQPHILSLTQSTEYGTVYTPDELKALAALCHEHGLLLHVDGSRFFNAAASLNCSLADISTHCGIDLLSLGGTKAGMMYGECVVSWSKELSALLRYKHKQVMQLASKTRFIAAQFAALLEEALWQRTAGHSNRMASLLAESLKSVPGISLTKPVQANAVFALMPPALIPLLQVAFPFYVWNELTHEVRLMCAWDTTEEEVKAFVQTALTTLSGNT